jgi:hypothetical protein
LQRPVKVMSGGVQSTPKIFANSASVILIMLSSRISGF